MNLYENSIDLKQTSQFTYPDHFSPHYKHPNSTAAIMTENGELFTLTADVEVAPERRGGNYDRSVVEEVWESAEEIAGNDSALWRRDENGLTICRSEYGNPRSSYGWEIIETSPGQFAMSSGGLKAVHVDS